MPLSYRNQSIDLQSKSMGWFLYDRDLCYGRVNRFVPSVLHENTRKPFLMFSGGMKIQHWEEMGQAVTIITTGVH